MITYTKILLISIVSFATTCVFSQDILSQQLESDYSGKPIIEAFQDIETQLGVKFFYKENWIENIKVPALKGSMDLESFITTVLNQNKLSYIEIQGTNIILVPNGYNLNLDNSALSFIKPVGNPLDKGKYSINKVEGVVKFGKTGEPIVGAVILNRQYNKQTITDYQGHYSMNLPGGRTKLEFSFIGLEKNIIEIDVFSNGNLDCELFDTPIEIEAVNVTAFSGKSNIERTQMGVVHVEMKSLSKLPVIMGEADIMKSMTLLPGVQTTGELSSGFNVRGGNADQNQVLIQGAPIYNTSHLFGLFSTLIPYAIQNVDMHKGTQPANFGGRMSSVMDIKLKRPSNEKITGKAGIGILNSTLFVEGPIQKDFCTFSLGARTTYSNWLFKKIPDIDIRQSKTQFYDLISNVHFNINARNQLTLFGYYGSDYFKYSTKNIYQYGSLISGLDYSHIINDIMSLGVNVSYTDYKNQLTYFEDPKLASTVKTGIKQLLGKSELSIQLNKQNIVCGIEGSNYIITPGIMDTYGDESTINPDVVDNENALELAGFAHDNISITDKISLMVGLRYSWYSKYGPDQSFVYDPTKPVSANSVVDTITSASGQMVKPYSGLEPRIGFKWGINETSSFKVGYHISRQYQHLISNSSSPTPSDYWKSVDNNIKPMLSQQYSLGYFKNFLNNIIETSAELYYKTIDNPVDYRNGAVLVMNPNIEREIIAGFAKAYGLEVMLKKNLGNFNGWISYTLSKSMIKVDGKFDEDKINNGAYFPTYNDKLHDLSISCNYQFTRRWNFAGNFIYNTGRPVTYPEKKYEFRSKEVVYFSDRNKYRLEANHRLDVSITYEGFLKKSKKVHPSFTFSVYNVYGHKNIYSVYYKSAKPSELNDYHKYGLYKLSIIGVPIPSITLNLSF